MPGTWIFLVGGCLLGAHSPAPLQRQVEGLPAEFADRGAGRALGVGPLLGREPRSGARADRLRGPQQHGGPPRLPPGGGHAGQPLQGECEGESKGVLIGEVPR